MEVITPVVQTVVAEPVNPLEVTPRAGYCRTASSLGRAQAKVIQPEGKRSLRLWNAAGEKLDRLIADVLASESTAEEEPTPSDDRDPSRLDRSETDAWEILGTVRQTLTQL